VLRRSNWHPFALGKERHTMNQSAYKQLWLKEEKQAFSGWDFSHLEGRWRSQPTDWDYRALVRERLRPTDRLLDMGTGGGEFLLSLNHPHRLTWATEAWPPNLQLCRERLSPLGITVIPVEDDARLNIPDGQFDIVINRHEAYDLSEVYRVLRPGGAFVTQQVGGENDASLQARLNPEGVPPHAPFSLETEVPLFEKHGFTVHYADECRTELLFFDVGAIAYYAKIIPWSYPHFSVERNFPQLLALQWQLEQDGCIATTEHRFVLVAQKPA